MYIFNVNSSCHIPYLEHLSPAHFKVLCKKEKIIFLFFTWAKAARVAQSLGHWQDREQILSTMGPDPRFGGDACTPLAPGGSSVHAGVPRNPPGLGLAPSLCPLPTADIDPTLSQTQLNPQNKYFSPPLRVQMDKLKLGAWFWPMPDLNAKYCKSFKAIPTCV